MPLVLPRGWGPHDVSLELTRFYRIDRGVDMFGTVFNVEGFGSFGSGGSTVSGDPDLVLG